MLWGRSFLNGRVGNNPPRFTAVCLHFVIKANLPTIRSVLDVWNQVRPTFQKPFHSNICHDTEKNANVLPFYYDLKGIVNPCLKLLTLKSFYKRRTFVCHRITNWKKQNIGVGLLETNFCQHLSPQRCSTKSCPECLRLYHGINDKWQGWIKFLTWNLLSVQIKEFNLKS